MRHIVRVVATLACAAIFLTCAECDCGSPLASPALPEPLLAVGFSRGFAGSSGFTVFQDGVADIRAFRSGDVVTKRLSASLLGEVEALARSREFLTGLAVMAESGYRIAMSDGHEVQVLFGLWRVGYPVIRDEPLPEAAKRTMETINDLGLRIFGEDVFEPFPIEPRKPQFEQRE